MKLVYIHGHGASRDSFNFIRSEIGGEAVTLQYDSKEGFDANLYAMVEQLQHESDLFFIAHSLGGLYALHLADALGERVLGAVTMATPYGGSESALALNFISPQQLYRDIHPTAGPVTRGRKITLHEACNWTAIVTTRGHSQLMGAANDGIVTVDSMRRRRSDIKHVEVESNHHEVVQSHRSVEIIRAALAEVEEMAAAA